MLYVILAMMMFNFQCGNNAYLLPVRDMYSETKKLIPFDLNLFKTDKIKISKGKTSRYGKK